MTKEEKIKGILLRGTGWYGTTKSHKEYVDKQAKEILELATNDIDIEQIFADVAGLPKKQHKNVIGDKWKYINAIKNALGENEQNEK